MTTSPCVKICTLDPVSGMCLGCGRTMDEISRWAAMNETERNRVLGELPARLKSRQNSNCITARK